MEGPLGQASGAADSPQALAAMQSIEENLGVTGDEIRRPKE